MNADGVPASSFGYRVASQPCRDKVSEILGEDVELFSSVNARRKGSAARVLRQAGSTVRNERCSLRLIEAIPNSAITSD